MLRLKQIIKNNKLLYEPASLLLKAIRVCRLKYAYIPTLKEEFLDHVGYPLNLDAPKTFNEKMQWLKCYYRDPLMTQCADKYEVREIIAKIIGPKYLTPIYGVYDSVAEINLDKLPAAFVLKPTHSSARVVICRDKKLMDWPSAFKKLSHWLKKNYYYQSGEWCYKDIKPRIICEKLLAGEMIDYKFMCFYGQPELMFTCSERDKGLKVTFFDMNFKRLPFIRTYPASTEIGKPKYFDKMVVLAKMLSPKFPFVRVDFYENAGNIYFGELTFFPGSGMEWFKPVEWDRKIGDLLDLSKLNKAFLKR